MNALSVAIKTFLTDAAEHLRAARLPGAVADALERLSRDVDRPCVVAVVGRMKAGKSTFINALLEADLAKVGVRETTATINHFCHGTPDPARPVRCYWRNGDVEKQDQAFLDGLQGNSLETLRRAEGIVRLESLVNNPFLERVVLVDTPGTNTVVEDHADRTAEFLALQRRLRDRNNADTERLGSAADAVVYVIGEIARTTDEAILEEFAAVTGGRSRPWNAVGVLAKIDLHPEILRRRHELAGMISRQLKETLNAVVPVSAGLQRAVDLLSAQGPTGIADFLAVLRRIPADFLEKLLDRDDFFLTKERADCRVTAAERVALLGDCEWGVFTTLARTAAARGFDPVASEAEWRSLAGFDPLRKLLDSHFLRRAELLRGHRVLTDARKVCDEVRFQHLPETRARDRDRQARFDRFVAFVRGADGDPVVARELEEFLNTHGRLATSAEQVEAVWKALDLRLAELLQELEELNADFAALQALEDHADDFDVAERDELRRLFGQYGLRPSDRVGDGRDAKFLADRQLYWRRALRRSDRPGRLLPAERAVAGYGLLFDSLGTDPDAPRS